MILLNSVDSVYYPDTKTQALAALRAYPGGLMIGGGINPENAGEFLEAGASHVIVTSYVFKEGRVDYGNLERLAAVGGRKHLVLDVSCRKRDGRYYVVTDRWQRFTDEGGEGEQVKKWGELRGIGKGGKKGPRQAADDEEEQELSSVKELREGQRLGDLFRGVRGCWCACRPQQTWQRNR